MDSMKHAGSSDSAKPTQIGKMAQVAVVDSLIHAAPAQQEDLGLTTAGVTLDPVSSHQWPAYGSSDALDGPGHGNLWPARGSSYALDGLRSGHVWPAFGSSESLRIDEKAKMVMPTE